MPNSSEFDQFIAPENFSLAWGRILRSTRYKEKDRLGISVYAPQKEKHIHQIIDALVKNTFQPQAAESIYVPKKDGTLRRLAFLSMDDRLVYQALGNVVIENSVDDVAHYTKNKRIFANVPTDPDRKGRWSHYVFKRTFGFWNPVIGRYELGQYQLFIKDVLSTTKRFLDVFDDPWMVKADIKGFYPSVNHAKLLELLKDCHWLTDAKLLGLLEKSLQRWTSSPYEQGIPIGYETSDHLANLYLLPVDQALKEYTVLRYVDDIYIFASTRAAAKEALAILDSEFGNLFLERNAVKTEIVRLTDTATTEIERKIKKDLSNLRDADKVPTKQPALLKKFFDNYDLHIDCDDYSDCLCVDEKISDPAIIAFVLYRLKKADDVIRRVALCMLDYYPNYSLQATTYLMRNYPSDDQVIKTLWFFVDSSNEPAELRLDCLQALYNMQGFDHISEFLYSTFNDQPEWYSRWRMLNFFEDRNESFDFVYQVAERDPSYVVRAKAIELCFRLTNSLVKKTQLINLAFADEDEFVKKLGIYLWRRQIDIEYSCLEATHLPERIRDVFLDQDELFELREFIKNFECLFGFPINPNFPIERVFGSRIEANQLLVDAIDAQENNMNQVVKSCYILTLNLLNSIVQIINEDNTYWVYDLDTLRRKHFFDDAITHQYTALLLTWYRDVLDGENVSPRGYLNLLTPLKNLFKSHLSFLHERFGLIMSLPLRQEIFISYSRQDEEWRDKVQSALKPHFRDKPITVWDDTHINPGEEWDKEIKQALRRAKVAVLLVSRHFLSSDYIHNNELPDIFYASEKEGLKIIWVAISPSAYKTTKLATIQCAHDPEKPLASREEHEQETALVQIAAHIAREFN